MRAGEIDRERERVNALCWLDLEAIIQLDTHLLPGGSGKAAELTARLESREPIESRWTGQLQRRVHYGAASEVGLAGPRWRD